MRIESSSVYPVLGIHFDLSHLNEYNDKLLEIEKNLYEKEKIKIAKMPRLHKETTDILDELEELQEKWDKFSLYRSNGYLEYLQKLIVLYRITAIKTGDTEWENFMVSKDIYKSTEEYIDSEQCILTLEKQAAESISSKKRKEVWLYCVYNFAHHLTRYPVAPPLVGLDDLYSAKFKQVDVQNIPYAVKCAYANALAAKDILENDYFTTENIVKENDGLFISLTTLIDFYLHYYIAKVHEDYTGIREEYNQLRQQWNVFIPVEIQQDLQRNTQPLSQRATAPRRAIQCASPFASPHFAARQR